MRLSMVYVKLRTHGDNQNILFRIMIE
jgi:hypothetical protein